MKNSNAIIRRFETLVAPQDAWALSIFAPQKPEFTPNPMMAIDWRKPNYADVFRLLFGVGMRFDRHLPNVSLSASHLISAQPVLSIDPWRVLQRNTVEILTAFLF
jgi:hypothetical protein